MSLTIRDYTDDDMPLVYSSWLRSLWDDATTRQSDARYIRKGVWHRGQHRLIEKLLTGGDAVVVVAELEGAIVGWICIDPEASTLFYGFVKPPYRGNGVFRELLAKAGVKTDPLMVATVTRPVIDWKRKGRAVEYDPYAAWAP